MKVLIVDDEALVRRSLGRAMRSKGHEVIEAPNGTTGLSSWRESDPDLVFLDVLMPDITGPQVLEQMGPHRAKVILMSAYSGDQNLEKARIQGADVYLPKPFEDIFDVVRTAEELMK